MTGRTAPFDDVAAELRRMRHDAGDPSYSSIVVEVARQRAARGVPAASATPGRTTIYDVFRDGRRRVDLDLVEDVVRALGFGEAEAARLRAVCIELRRSADIPRPTPGPLPPGEETTRSRPSRRAVVVVLAAAVVLNLLGRLLVTVTGLPLHLDMVGTAIAAVALGPWWGAGVGASTNLLGVSITGGSSVLFAVVNVIGALMWGYGVRRLGLGRTIGRYAMLNVAVAVVCSMVAAPIVLLVYGGGLGHGSDGVTENLVAISHSMLLAVVSSNVLVSLADKLVTGFVAAAVVASLPWRTAALEFAGTGQGGDRGTGGAAGRTDLRPAGRSVDRALAPPRRRGESATP